MTLWADASVDIEGNNYAPIMIYINFDTRIQNYGQAEAASGDVAAGVRTAPLSAGSAGAAPQNSVGGNSSAGGSVGSESHARGGDAVAVSNSVNAAVVSNQLSSANGSHPLAAETVSSMLRSLPSGTWNPFSETTPGPVAVPTVAAGLASTSGDSLASGMRSTILFSNNQLSACQDPDHACLARNTAVQSIVVRDNPDPAVGVGEPGSGGSGSGRPGVHAGSGFAGVNATPTPVPQRSGSSSSRPAAATSSSSDDEQSYRPQPGPFLPVRRVVPFGQTVVVDLFGQLPGRRLPPMLSSGTARRELGRRPGTAGLASASCPCPVWCSRPRAARGGASE